MPRAPPAPRTSPGAAPSSWLPGLGTWKHSTANAVNDRGQVVGASSTYAGSPSFGGAATLWQCGRATDLNDVTSELPEGLTLVSANDINDRGQIIGDGRVEDSGAVDAVRLTPGR